jgi:hypothetical protein
MTPRQRHNPRVPNVARLFAAPGSVRDFLRDSLIIHISLICKGLPLGYQFFAVSSGIRSGQSAPDLTNGAGISPGGSSDQGVISDWHLDDLQVAEGEAFA